MSSSYKRVARFAASLTLAGMLGTCGENPMIATIPVRVELTPALDTVYVGETAMRIDARVFNARDEVIPGAPIIWRSDQPFVAEVDSLSGAVTGVLPGVAAVTARAGSAVDTAEVFVLNALRVVLPLDTILLAPNDTITIPVEVLTAPGMPVPPVTFGGGAPGIATVDPGTGLLTAVGAGEAAFVAVADTVTAGGIVAVIDIADPAVNGLAHARIVGGGINAATTMASRAFNFPTDDAGTATQLVALTPDSVHRLIILVIDSLSGPTTRAVGTVTAGGLGSDPTCLPPTTYLHYRLSLLSTVTALSVAGGTVTVTSYQALPGGHKISGRMDAMLQRTDLTGADGRIRIRGTFVVPLVSLTSCPS